MQSIHQMENWVQRFSENEKSKPQMSVKFNFIKKNCLNILLTFMPREASQFSDSANVNLPVKKR